MMFQYFVKVVPTVYMKVDGEVLRTNQFSVTRHEKVANGLLGDQGLPGVFVLYELADDGEADREAQVLHSLPDRRVRHHWGMFTVAGLIDHSSTTQHEPFRRKLI